MPKGDPTCHPDRKLFARGLCQSCYLRLRRKERPAEAARKARGLKLCRGCGEEKALSEFHVDRGRPMSRCKVCRIAEVRAYQLSRRDDPSFVEDQRRRSRESARRHGRRHHLKQAHGLTLEDYDDLLAKQGGVCAICGEYRGRRLAVDHDHTTGRVRGLLCDPCNQGIGFLDDDVSRLRAAIRYLTRKRPVA